IVTFFLGKKISVATTTKKTYECIYMYVCLYGSIYTHIYTYLRPYIHKPKE
uniref:Uncharacterized protein n=1 Tax=Macaca fascicularis TaxID=9541 RepID=A0A7N9D4Z7_MACFA